MGSTRPSALQTSPLTQDANPTQYGSAIIAPLRTTSIQDSILRISNNWEDKSAGHIGSHATGVRQIWPDFTFSALSEYALYLCKHMSSRDFARIFTGFPPDFNWMLTGFYHPPYLQKNMPQKYAIQWGSMWHKSPLKSRDLYRKYGIRTLKI